MGKLVAVFHLVPLCASAGIIVFGSGPMGMLADATITVPPDPNNGPIAPMRASSDGSWRGIVTVFGGTGKG